MRTYDQLRTAQLRLEMRAAALRYRQAIAPDFLWPALMDRGRQGVAALSLAIFYRSIVRNREK